MVDEPVTPIVPDVVMTLRFKPMNQQLTVEGIPDNLLLAYGMLEVAKQVVQQRSRRAQRQSPIVQLPAGSHLRQA
jgi:hypothetical protein